MFRSTKLSISLIALVLAVGIITAALAQDEPTTEEKPVSSPEINLAVGLDENIQPADLGIKEPKILPGSPFYFFKDIGRGLTSAFTFNPVAKAELKLKFTNERLLEAKKLTELKTAEAPLKVGVLEKALDSYKKEIAGLRNAAGQIKENVENPQVNEFVNKFLDEALKQQKLFGKLEKELPAEIHPKIAEVKEENITSISEVGLSLAPAEVLGEKLAKVIDEGKGSSFKNFKNLEVLKAVEEKVPEVAKEAIRKAQENSLKRLQGNLEAMPEGEREKFNDYVKNIGGSEVRHLQVLDILATEELPATVREEIVKAQEKVIEKTAQRLKLYQEANLEQAKTKFFEPLTSQGQLEDIRVVKELENNLSPELIGEIASIKEAVKGKVIEVIERAKTSEKQKEILEKIEKKFYDVKQLEVLREIEDVIAAPSKEFYEQLKEKTVQTMQQEIKKAEGLGKEAKEAILERVAGDSPEHIKILREVGGMGRGVPTEIMPQITKQTIERISGRIELIKEPARLESLKKKIEREEIKSIIQQAQPAMPPMIKKVEERLQMLKEAKPTLPEAEKPRTGCPQWVSPAPGFCKDGKIIWGKDERGCPLPPKCIIGGEKFPESSPQPSLPPNLPQLLEGVKEFIPPTIKQIEIEAVPVGPAAEPVKPPARETAAPAEPALPEKTPSVPSPTNTLCVQVITPAMGPDGKCKDFPTPCDVPDGWKKVEKCPAELPNVIE